jgi:hypothetical protein
MSYSKQRGPFSGYGNKPTDPPNISAKSDNTKVTSANLDQSRVDAHAKAMAKYKQALEKWKQDRANVKGKFTKETSDRYHAIKKPVKPTF